MKKITYSIIILAWVQSVSFNIAHPITPNYVSYLSISDRMFGVFFATMSAGIVLSSPVWGILADRGKPLKYMLIGSFFYLIGQIGFGFSEQQTLMVISRLISGIGAGALLTITPAVLIQKTDPKYVGRALAWLGAFIILGASIGYYLGGFISTFKDFLHADSYQFVFYFQVLMILIYMLLVYVIIHPIKDIHVSKKTTMLDNIKSMLSIPIDQKLFFFALMFATISYIFMSKYLDVYFNTLSYTPDILGTFVLITGVVSVITTLGLVPLIINKRKIFWISMIFIVSIVSLIVTFQMSSFLIAMYTVYLLYIIAKAAYQPFEQSYIASFQSLSYGSLMGVRQLFIGLGMVIGPIGLGYVYDLDPITSFHVAALMIFIAFVLTLISSFSSKYKKVIKLDNNA